MKCNQNDASTFSFKELLEMKEKKATELMPPPRTPVRTMKDIIQELRKNLTETSSNAQQNQQLHDELNKIKLMNKESQYNNNINNIIFNSNINNNESDALLADFDTCLNNNSHNSHNDQNLDDDYQLNSSMETGKEKENYIKFNKLPNPKNKAEIKFFVNNLICYINCLISCPSLKNNTKLSDELLVFKYKLETRYNDYRNHGLNEQYFINILNQNQEEIINKLGIGIWGKKEKKDDNSNSLNINNIINIHSNYSFIGKKRKKSLSEMRSITDGSSSYEDRDADGEADSP
jgi:hypothetical protein